MKSLKHYLFLALIISVSPNYLPQISEITRLPVQSASQSIKESAPVRNKKLKLIINEFKKADRYEVNFSAIGIASGVYIYRTKVNEFIISKKMILMK